MINLEQELEKALENKEPCIYQTKNMHNTVPHCKLDRSECMHAGTPFRGIRSVYSPHAIESLVSCNYVPEHAQQATD